MPNFIMMTKTPSGGTRFECVEYVRMDGETINYKRSYDQNVGAALAAIIRVGRGLDVHERQLLDRLFARALVEEPWLQDQATFIEKKGNRPALIAVKDATGR
jgi:hypothetical protein